MRSIPDLHVTLHLSWLRVALAVGTMSATAALVLSMPLPVWVRLAGGLACLAAGALDLRGALQLAHVRVVLTAERRITVTSGSGNMRRGEVLDASYVSALYTAVVWRPDGTHTYRAIPVLADAASAADRRRLRVMLRYGRSRAVVTDVREASSAAWLKGDLAH
ncbi:MAG: hypothetical protein M3Z31_02300 [Pseudomonadota bacterium]|nr:hypothetical protein [Pseudomonadota bacterium]